MEIALTIFSNHSIDGDVTVETDEWGSSTNRESSRSFGNETTICENTIEGGMTVEIGDGDDLITIVDLIFAEELRSTAVTTTRSRMA